jgi:hypothetical protein
MGIGVARSNARGSPRTVTGTRVAVGVGVRVAVGVAVGVGDGVAVRVAVAVGVAVPVAIAEGVLVAARLPCPVSPDSSGEARPQPPTERSTITMSMRSLYEPNLITMSSTQRGAAPASENRPTSPGCEMMP